LLLEQPAMLAATSATKALRRFKCDDFDDRYPLSICVSRVDVYFYDKLVPR
jgi:hypothetical protein